MDALRIVIVCMAIFASVDTLAEESLWDNFRIHGFASQAVVDTSANRYFGDSTETSLEFTEIGFNASLRIHPRILLAGQTLARRAGDMSDGTPALDYALADVTFLSSLQRRVGLRIGRIKNPLGLYNETRDVPFTRPGIFLPQVIYFDKVRNLVLSSDGIMLYADSYHDFGNFSLTLGHGQGIIDENVEWTYLGNDFNGDLEADDNTWLASLWYSTLEERLKLGLSAATLTMKFDPDQRSLLAAGSTDIIYWVASMQYDTKNWTLSAEYAREPLEWQDYGPLVPNRKVTTEGYYLQGIYRIRPNMELLLRYEEGFADRDDRDGSELASLTGGPAFNAFSKIWTAGLRWDINHNWMVRAEYQHHRGTFILSPRENRNPGQLIKDWNLLAIQFAFRF